MFTLKIRWVRYEDGELKDETTLFIEADQVQAHGLVLDPKEQMKSWPEGSYFDYSIEPSPNVGHASRLIQVDKDGKSTWYLASHAWLLGSDGKTIERLN